MDITKRGAFKVAGIAALSVGLIAGGIAGANALVNLGDAGNVGEQSDGVEIKRAPVPTLTPSVSPSAIPEPVQAPVAVEPVPVAPEYVEPEPEPYVPPAPEPVAPPEGSVYHEDTDSYSPCVLVDMPDGGQVCQ